ncbi:hypothetical protein BOX15_Mlig032782g3 [Macrostomum lignano]|uniref:Uncharacterized protein n=1 Tax=Macrostomum lignano TaxID=282301 RepID=A0A267EZB0_9PLAT|nr:hypothetical protein BOX15_Mlig032782g2 [Macrostomum lignano]PAA91380.1 hypothetical protein BOX15_Mlig032782g3 [Macrostomum lignano]
MPTPSRTGNGAAATKRPVDCLVAVEDVRVFNPGTLYMRHALPAYIRPFLVCLRGLAGPEAAVSYRAVTFNRDPDGRDFGQLTAQEQPLHSDEALLRLLSEVTFMRYPDPARSERVPVGHLGRLLSGLISSSCSGSAAERHLLLIVHSRFEDNMDQLRSVLEPLTSLTILSPRRNDQLTELFGLVNGKEDLGDSGISPHPKWELVLVPECIRLSPPLPPQQAAAPAQVQSQQTGAQAAPDSSAPQPVPSSAAAAPADVTTGRLLWSGRLQFSKPNLCPATNVQFVQLGPWSADWSFSCFDQPLPCATCALLKPEIAQTIERLPQGVGKDRLLVRPAANAEMSPLLRLFESASSNSAQMALIFCDLKTSRPAGAPGATQLARCLVARYDAQLGSIVASIPADQDEFLRDMRTRFQQRQPAPQLQQPPVVRAQPPQPQTQPHVMVYMPPSHPSNPHHQHHQQPQYRHQIVSQPAGKFPAGVATTSVYTMRPMQSATMVINPVATAGPPPAKISRIMDPASFQPAAPGSMRIISSHSGQPMQQPQLINAPITIQRLTLPSSSYQHPQQQQQQQQQHHQQLM